MPILPPTVRSVAQPGSAPASGAGGRRFESSRSDHYISEAGFICNDNQYPPAYLQPRSPTDPSVASGLAWSEAASSGAGG